MRRLFAALVVVLTALVLTGCMKVDMDIEVHDDSMVSGEMTMAVSKEMKTLMESFAQEFGEGADVDTDGMDGNFFESDDVPEGAKVEPFENDKFIGQTMTFEKIGLAEINESATGDDAEEWTIRRDGDTFVFTAEGDFASEDAAEAEGDPMDLGLDKLFADAELRIAVTFPGDVIESNGEIDGRTVVWTPEFGETLTMRAVAEAEGNSVLPDVLDPTSGEGGGIGVLVAVVAGVVVLLLLALGLLLAVRRKRSTDV